MELVITIASNTLTIRYHEGVFIINETYSSKISAEDIIAIVANYGEIYSADMTDFVELQCGPFYSKVCRCHSYPERELRNALMPYMALLCKTNHL